ncbi:MAG TPA: glycosyltransferase [Candidatus Didemnitutus sp.]|jgi:glycosyltransferase involved in cell wall biosynthesis
MSNDASLPFASVTICTYKRPRWLRETLECLTRQDYPRDRWELIVVDNNSRDDTPAVVESFRDAPQPPRYVFEERQGSSHARNRGVAEARGEIIIFTDDDMLGGPGWLRLLVAPFLLPGNGRIAAVGGEVVPVFPEGLPPWLVNQWRPLRFRADVGPLRPDQLPMTANLAFRAGIFKEVGLFRTDLGRIGNRSLFNEDHEFCRRVLAKGHVMWYTPIGELQHQIPAGRLTFRYTFKQVYDAARSRVVESTGHGGKGVGWALSRLIGHALHLTWCLFLSLLLLLTFQPGRSKRFVTRAARGLGYVVESARAIGRLLRGGQPAT